MRQKAVSDTKWKCGTTTEETFNCVIHADSITTALNEKLRSGLPNPMNKHLV